MKLEGKNTGLRIIQLQYEPFAKEAKIVEGYEMWLEPKPIKPSRLLFYQNKFGFCDDAIIRTDGYSPGGKRVVNCVHGYRVKDLGDGFKEINLGISEVEVKEEYGILLMVGIGAGKVEIDREKRISGRYGEDGIFELLPNDKIKVTRGDLIEEEFVAIKFEKQMYLIKSRRK